MDAEALQRFLELEQQEMNMTIAECKEAIAKYTLGEDKVWPFG